MRTKLYPNTPEFDSTFEALLKSVGNFQYNGNTIPMGGRMHHGQCRMERNILLHRSGFKTLFRNCARRILGNFLKPPWVTASSTRTLYRVLSWTLCQLLPFSLRATKRNTFPEFAVSIAKADYTLRAQSTRLTTSRYMSRTAYIGRISRSGLYSTVRKTIF